MVLSLWISSDRTMPATISSRTSNPTRLRRAQGERGGPDLFRPLQRQTYAPFTRTRTQAGAPTTAPPTTAPPTTARRVVRRATPATLTGVSGRPTRACALSKENERPSFADQSIEPAAPNATIAAANNNRFKLICFIAISLSLHAALVSGERCPTLICIKSASTSAARAAARTHRRGDIPARCAILLTVTAALLSWLLHRQSFRPIPVPSAARSAAAPP